MPHRSRSELTRAGLVLLITGNLLSCSSFGAAAKGDRLLRMQQSRQYKETRFVNKLPMTEDNWDAGKMWTMFMDWIGGNQPRVPAKPIPVLRLTASDFAQPSTDLTVRWLGHSTSIIEIEGKRILTDPVWSQRTSPYQFVGPKRFFDPVIAIENLPPLDAVIISHDHYDHLDSATIMALRGKVDFYVPLGVGAHLEKWGVLPARIHEFDWWESAQVGGLKLVCTPARHFSGRGFSDRNHTLWASWSIIGQKRRVFFSGDSGLFPELSEIGDRLGPFDLTMMESGAYNPLWPDVHMGPEQAVIGHRALRGKIMLPIHWGLFTLAPHGWTEPIERLRVMAKRDGDSIAQPMAGMLFAITDPLPVKQWWPAEKWETVNDTPVWSTHIDPNWMARYSKALVRNQP